MTWIVILSVAAFVGLLALMVWRRSRSQSRSH
jgi:hypothetical protein